MDFAFLALNALGGFVKHIIPGKTINKFIPVINFATATVGRKVMTNLPWTACAVQGFYDAGAASITYQTVKIPVKAKTEKSI